MPEGTAAVAGTTTREGHIEIEVDKEEPSNTPAPLVHPDQAAAAMDIGANVNGLLLTAIAPSQSVEQQPEAWSHDWLTIGDCTEMGTYSNSSLRRGMTRE